jgi:hypothetical protein
MMEDYLIAWRWYLDPKNVDQANQYAAAFTKLPVTAFQGWAWLPEKDYYRDPWAVPDLEALQKDIRQMHEHGLIAGTVDVRKHADLSFIEQARARVKP